MSIDCARVMRGIRLTANAVILRAASLATTSGCRDGTRVPSSIAPSRMRSVSCTPSFSLTAGACTLTTRSAPAYSAAASASSAAPASANSESVKNARSPAPRSTDTAIPALTSLRTDSGTSATRRSPDRISSGTTILIGDVPPDQIRASSRTPETVGGARYSRSPAVSRQPPGRWRWRRTTRRTLASGKASTAFSNAAVSALPSSSLIDRGHGLIGERHRGARRGDRRGGRERHDGESGRRPPGTSRPRGG